MKNSISVFLVLLLSMSAFADGPYGSADYSRRDCYTHDKLKACWEIDPGTTGDHFQKTGSFESWTGGDPDGWNDISIGSGSVAQNTVYVYDGSSSALLTGTGGDAGGIRYVFSFKAGKVYQLRFRHLGDGVDVVAVTVWLSGTAYYNFTSDAWQAGAASTTATTATVWTDNTVNIITGVIDRDDYNVDITATDGNVFYIDRVELIELKSTITSKPGNYELSVANGLDHPAYGDEDTLYKSKAYTGPAYDRGARFDGTNDYFYRANDGTFNPAGNFSVACSIIPVTTSSTGSIISKYDTAGGERGWDTQCASTNALLVYVSANGVGNDSFTVNGSLYAGYKSDYVFSYFGPATSYAYVDFSSNSKTLSQTSINDSTSTVNVGSRYDGGSPTNTIIEKCCYWDKGLSATEAAKYISPYYPGVRYNGLNGAYPTSCTNTTSHATCSQTRCRDGTTGKCEAEWNSYASFGQYTGLIENNSFETYTGDPSVANFTDWTETEYAGDGTANITAYLADSVHGDVSARCVKTGSTSYCSWQSDCLTTGIGSDMYGYIKARGDATLTDLYIAQYSGVACTGYLSALTFKANQALTDVWTWYGGSVAAASWDGSTQSYYVVFRDRSAQASDSFFDLVDVKMASYRTPPVHVPASGGAVTYTARSLVVYNPLADYVQEEDGYAWDGGFCWSAWVYNNWSATDGVAHDVFHLDDTDGGDNNRIAVYKTTDNKIAFYVYDSAGASRYDVSAALTDTTWTAGKWKFVEGCTDNAGSVDLHWYNVNNSTWYDGVGVAGAGTGILDDVDSTLDVGHKLTATHWQGYIANWAIMPYNAVWPRHGFNGGRPPKDPY